jgi:hypothetical protein
MIQENEIPTSLSQAFTTHHPYVFTVTLPLSEGRAGTAWEPSNKISFPPRNNASLALPHASPFASALQLSFLTLGLESSFLGSRTMRSSCYPDCRLVGVCSATAVASLLGIPDVCRLRLDLCLQITNRTVARLCSRYSI